MMEEDHWCVDLEGLCLADDAHLMEIEEGNDDRVQQERGHSDEMEDLEEQKQQAPKGGKLRSVSKDRKSSESNNKPSEAEDGPTLWSEDSPKKEASSSEDVPKKSVSFGLPFNFSLTNEKKEKSTTDRGDLEKEDADKEDTATVHSDESSGADRNTNNNNGNHTIQANVFMISGCQDNQTSADVSNVSSFSLPDPNGSAGGACTSALLKVLYSGKGATVPDMTFVRVLSSMRNILRNGKYSQIPQLTSSQQMNVNQQFYIVPPGCKGIRRAVLIGINYSGQNGELSGCHNDCLNMKDYIMDVWGFAEENVVVLIDDGKHDSPTRANILNAYQDLAEVTEDGDAAFCHYSGHGGRVRDDDYGEEDDGYDATLVPVDYNSAGQIRDDDLYTSLVCAMTPGATLVSLMDCCHSATVLDLPFKYRAGAGATATTGGHKLNPFSLDGGNCLITICLLLILLIVVIVLIVQNV